MSLTQDMEIVQAADEPNGLADALEKECATWTWDYDISNRPKFPTRANELRHEEEKRRTRFLWGNAVVVGGVLLKLLDAGAFEQEARIKNALGQMRAEMSRAHRENKAPLYNAGRKRPACPGSQPWSKEAHEMFLVKTVEGFCKLWAKSYDDRRAFVSYSVPSNENAALQTKMLRSLSQELKKKYARSGV